MTTAREAQNVPPQTLCSAQQTWDIFQNSTLPGDCNGCFTICWADGFCIGLWWSRCSVAFFFVNNRNCNGRRGLGASSWRSSGCLRKPASDWLADCSATSIKYRLQHWHLSESKTPSPDAIRCDEAWPIDWNLTSNKHQNRTRKDIVKYDTFNYHQCLAWRTQSQSDRSLQIFVRLVAWVATTWLLFWQLGSKTQFVGSLSA